MKECVKKCFFKALFWILSGIVTDRFWQFFPAVLLQVQSTCPEQYLREIFFSCKKQVVLRRFSDFEGEIFGPLSKKFQKGCKKNPFMSQEKHCEWIFSRNILCPYFYSDIEQKILDLPRNVFKRVITTNVDASK